MSLTHEIGSLLISTLGIVLIVLSGPLPRQVHRWHVHAIEQVEPVMLTWLARGIGLALIILGVVTLLNPA